MDAVIWSIDELFLGHLCERHGVTPLWGLMVPLVGIEPTHLFFTKEVPSHLASTADTYLIYYGFLKTL